MQYQNKPGDSNANQVTIPAIISLVLCPIFVGIRFWTRWTLSGGVGADDWTILGSLIFSAAVSGLMIASCAYGFGQHIYNIHPENKLIALKLFYVAQLFYKININLTKASFLLLYLRIFVQKPFRVVCWIMLGIISAYIVASSAASIWQCTPIARAWDKRIPGTCINITKNWYANGGFSIATDLVILIMPMPIIYQLSMPMTQRVALMAIFAVGSFIVATSVMRMTTLNFSTTSPDITYDIASTLWTLIESNVGIVCACLPMFRQPLSHFFPGIFPSTTHKSKNSNLISSSAARAGYRSEGSSKNDWRGDHGSKREGKGGDIDLREMMSEPENDSKEYILRGDGKVVRSLSGIGLGERRELEDGHGRGGHKERGIEKTVGYSVYSEGVRDRER